MHQRITPLLLLAVAGVAATPIAAQVGTLRDALPANTILYIAAPDIDSSIEEMQSMPLLRMWKEAEVQDFFADALKMGSALWKEQLEKGRAMHEQGMLPFSPDELMKLRLSGAGFALTALDLGKGGDDTKVMPKIGVVGHFDFGESAASWQKIIKFGLMMAEQQSHGELIKEMSKVGDVDVTTLVPPETEMSLNVAFVGNGMLFGTLRSDVTSILERMQSDEAALSASVNFSTTFAKLDSDGAELEVYLQPGPVIDFALKALATASEEAPEFPVWLNVAGIGRAIDSLGLRSVQAIGATSSYQPDQASGGNKSVSQGFVYAPEASRKGLFAGTTRPLDLSFLKWVPKDVASFSGATFDLGSAYDAMVSALNAYDEELAKNVLGMLARYEEQFGLKLKEDLLGSLGDEMISWSMPVAALGTTPEMAILLKVRDQERLLKTLRTISKLSNDMFEVDESQRRGMTVYQIQINWDPTGGMGFNPLDMFIPTFAFKNDYLVAGFSTGDVKRVFKRMDREDDPAGDIRSNAEFKPYLAHLPQAVTSVSFSDWKANFEGIYQLVTSLAAFIPVDDDIPIDLSLLPDVSTLTQHLFGAVSWSTTSPDGHQTMSIGPWGPETMVLLFGGIGAGAAVGVAAEQGHINFR